MSKTAAFLALNCLHHFIGRYQPDLAWMHLGYCFETSTAPDWLDGACHAHWASCAARMSNFESFLQPFRVLKPRYCSHSVNSTSCSIVASARAFATLRGSVIQIQRCNALQNNTRPNSGSLGMETFKSATRHLRLPDQRYMYCTGVVCRLNAYSFGTATDRRWLSFIGGCSNRMSLLWSLA